MIVAYIAREKSVYRTTSLDEIRAARAAKQVTWVHITAREDAIEEMLAKDFGLHPLTIEDVWHSKASPKVEDFDEYLYIRVHGVQRAGDSAKLDLAELDIVLSPEFVITHDAQSACAIQGICNDLDRSPRLLAKGTAWIAHALLDSLVDGYVPIIDFFDSELEALETNVMEKAGTPDGKSVLTRIFELKGSLQALRRIAVHQREILLRLSRAEFDEIPVDALPFYRDVTDHFLRVTDLAESYRDLVTNALEVYLNVQSNRMNEVMKTLTLISTIMLPLTFIAGVYGMNFEHMPELKWEWGYGFALLFMASVAISIIVWFRHKKWL